MSRKTKRWNVSTVGRRNHLHTFLSLVVNCENKLRKVYCVPRLYLQKFTSLKFRHPHRPWIAFLQIKLTLKIDTLNFKTKLQHAECSLLGGGRNSPSPLAESLLIPCIRKNATYQNFISPLKNNFHVIFIITLFLAVVVGPVTFTF